MSPLSYEQRVAWAEACALLRTRCHWCELQLRPCNVSRHVAARHFRQLTIDDMTITDSRSRTTKRGGRSHAA